MITWEWTFEAPYEFATVRLDLDKAVEPGKSEGIGSGVGDAGPADKGDKVLVRRTK